MSPAELGLDISLGLLIGLTLGLLGGGGSILTVPALVYIVGQSPQAAITTSLMVVGANSASGAYFHRNQGTLNGQVALLFGGVGMLTAYFAAGLSQYFSSLTLMLIFAGLMLVVGIFMIIRNTPPKREDKEHNLAIILISGAVVGILTGFLGVGGGFLIVPALVMLVGLPIQQAIGTSLVVISMNSLAGFVGHISTFEIDLTVALVFVVAGIAGSFIGTRLNKYIKPDQLRRIFAIFIIILALALIADNAGQIIS